LAEVAVGVEGSQLEDGLGAAEAPSRTCDVESVFTCLHAPSMIPVAMGHPLASAVG
jgi:hypothetical protein